MKDELHKHIIEALGGELDGKLFEECVVDLLQPVYPSLTPIKGGHDDGRDGLYINMGGREVPLVCTTGVDIRSNLRNNLKQYVTKGHRGREAIFATSREVTPQERNKLEKIAGEEGFTLIQVHPQDDIALRLYRDATWLKRLLNIESKQQALSVNPVTTRPIFSLPIRGREDTFEWLDRARSDYLVFGQPGSGKTFVVRDFIMRNEGLFVVSDDRNQITQEVREKNPKYLVVDDAHTRRPLLQALRQIRQDTGAEFKIIATTWSNYRGDIKNDLLLTDGDILELELLGRDIMLEIIKDCGIKGPDVLQAQIIRQAEGKPGLAATLCQLALAGDALKVYLGDTLGEHLVALIQKELGDDSLSLLAVVALGGDGGIEIKDIAKILKSSEMEVQTIATKLAFGGVIAVVPENALSVRPPSLRYYLAKSRFFGDIPVDPFQYLDQYQRLEDVADVMINAGVRGGKVDKGKLLALVEKLNIPKLFAGYAAFGKKEAEEMTSKHPDMAVAAPFDYLAMTPEAIIPLLLQKAIGDNRALHSTPHHPLRILQDWAEDALPGVDNVIKRRRALVKCLMDWRQTGKDPYVFTQALAFALVPFFEIHRTDPGSGHSLSYARGHLSPTELKDLIVEWHKIKSLLANLQDKCWRPLIELLEHWVYERGGVNMPSAEQIQVLNEGATEILDDLSELSKDLPGVQARLESIAQHLNHAYSIAHDREYDILFPDTKRDAATRKENEEKQRAPVSDLAAEYAKQDPATVMRRVMALTKQADIANHSWPHHTHLLASDIAAQASNLTDWAKAAMAELEDPYFASPFLLALQEEDPEAARPILHQALKHDQHKYCAGDVILSRSFTDDDLWQAVQPILANFGMTARVLVIRNQMDTETVRHLLESGCDEVALPVATALSWSFREGTIDNDLLPIWEKALINAKLTDDYNLDNQITEALELHPATIMKWLRAKLREEPNPETMFDGFSHVAHDLIKVLTRDQRLELIRELPANYRAERIVRNLIDGDLGLFKELLANPNTRGYQLIPLSQVSGDSWIGFAEVAFSANWDEDDVLTASRKLDDSWSGPASDHYKGLMGVAALGTHATDPRIVSISNKLVEMYKVLYEGALRREKREDVYGFDD